MAGGDDDDTFINAEIQMQEEIAKKIVTSTIDFERGSNANSASCDDEIAADLAYIMQSAFNTSVEFDVLPEDEVEKEIENDSSADDSESDDDVKITLVKNSGNTVNEVISLSSSSEDEICVVDDANNTHAKRKKGENKAASHIKSNTEDCEKNGSDGNVKKVIEEVSSNECSSSEDETMGPPTLLSIMRNERRVVNSVPRVPDEVLLDEVVVNVEEIVLTPEDHLNQLGSICRTIEKQKMVIVTSKNDAPALDAESAFFLEDRTYLGKVFETFGPVKIPYYSVHLSSQVDVSKVTVGTKVYFIPFNQKLTIYVFVDQLKKLKGSDASWRDDCEPPVQHLDYSDDDEEQPVNNNNNNNTHAKRKKGENKAGKLRFKHIKGKSDTGEKHPQSQTKNRNKNDHSHHNNSRGSTRNRGQGSARKPGGNNNFHNRRQGSTWKPGVNDDSHNYKNSNYNNRRHGNAWKPGANVRNSRFHNNRQQNCEMNDNIQLDNGMFPGTIPPSFDTLPSQRVSIPPPAPYLQSPVSAAFPQFVSNNPCPSRPSGPPVSLMQNMLHVPHPNHPPRPPVPPRPPAPPISDDFLPPGNHYHPLPPQGFENRQHHPILNDNQNQFQSQGINNFTSGECNLSSGNQNSFQDSRNSRKKETVKLNGFTFKI